MAKDIIDEVKEDLKNEKEAHLTMKITKIFCILAVVMVVGAALFVWKEKTVSELKSHIGIWFNKAFLAKENNDLDAAVGYFDKIINYSHQEVAALAYLNKASILYKQNKPKDAENTLLEMIKIEHFDKALTDLAKLIYVEYQYNLGADENDLIKEMLSSITKDDCPWRFSALRLKALYEIKQKKLEDAKQDLRKILDDPKANKVTHDFASNILSVISR